MIPPDTDEPRKDEVIEEVRAIRQGLAAEFDYDPDWLFDEMERREAASDRPKRAPSPKWLATSE